MMTQEGTYTLSKISEQEYIHIVQSAKEVIALMGYPSCALQIKKITGIDIKTAGNILKLENGDMGVICEKLSKGFEYYKIEYSL